LKGKWARQQTFWKSALEIKEHYKGKEKRRRDIAIPGNE